MEWPKFLTKFLGAKGREGEDAAGLEARAESLEAAFPSDPDRAGAAFRAGHTVADAIAALRAEGEQALATANAATAAAVAERDDLAAKLAALAALPHEGNPPAPAKAPAAKPAAALFPNLSPSRARFAAALKLPNRPEDN